MAKQQTIPVSFEVTHDIKATKWVRFFNVLIDHVAMYFIIFTLAAITALIAVALELDGLLMWMQNISTLESYGISFFILVLYYGIFESLSARTLGKLITGSKVVMAEGGAKPTSDVILRRSLCRLIPFEFLSFLGEYANGWHDSISGTAVVNVKRYEAELYRTVSFEELGKQDVA